MTTNQTIDGVPRELIERLIVRLSKAQMFKWSTELRALLDAPATGVCRGCFTEQPTGIAGIACKTCAEVEARRAAQPQGEPVACAHGIRAPHACDQCESQNVVPDYWEDPDNGTCIDQWTKIQGLNGTNAYSVPLYRHAEQPAPVAVASLEIVGRQCFPSETMEKMHGYRTEPWVDGNIHESPSTPGLYTVEPLVRLSDVDRLNSKP